MRATSRTLVLCLLLGVGCGPKRPIPEPPTTPLFTDLGSHHRPVTTSSPLAQQYFDQGLRLLYGFNHDEARKSFEQAARLDPNCAMAYWGIALVVGPNYNLPMDPKHEQLAWDNVQKALALKPKVSENERAYIDALARRYTLDPAVDRKQLQADYARAMRDVARRFPEDLDAATLFAEAMMNLRPWDLWTKDGKPQPGTEEIIATLESVLFRNPNHPGANHYYIHATEASPNPGRALAAAARLKRLAPGAGHLVHMPAHVYIRTGRYDEAAAANVRAIEVDRAYLERAKPDGMYPMIYYPHNIHFLWVSAAMAGREKEAIEAARDLLRAAPMSTAIGMPMMEMFTPAVYFALVRFGRWEEVLAEPAPPAELPFTTGMWHYARGMAFANKGNAPAAREELAALHEIAGATPNDLQINLNSARLLLGIAGNVLAGEVAARRGRGREAIAAFRKAVELQDQLNYDEPPAWYFPVREALGAAQLAAGRPRDAEATFRRDLELNPENPRSLYGLSKALEKQGKKTDAAVTARRFAAAWKGGGAVPEIFAARR